MKRPQLYYQEIVECDIPRLRIIWPDGHCQFLYDDDRDKSWGVPCWAEQQYYEPEALPHERMNGFLGFHDRCFGKCSSGARAIKLMNAHDAKCGWPPAELIGEL